MSSSSKKTNNHKYNHDKELQEWYCMAQTKLKKKITDNLQKRVVTSSQAINYAIKRFIQDTKSNHFVDKYEEMLPLFTIPQHLIDNALSQLTKKVDEWVGVDISSMNQRPKDFKKYWKTSDNWWNRYKAEWIGDYFFWPLLQDVLFQYIITLTAKQQPIEAELQSTKELLYFICLRKLLYSEVSFTRARSQPLILDQSFVKSDGLQQFFCFLGNQHNIDWIIPPNQKRNKNRLHIRHYVREWTDNVLALKQQTYDIVVMGKHDLFYDEPVAMAKAAAEIYGNIPPAVKLEERCKINMVSMSPKTPINIPSGYARSDSEMKKRGLYNQDAFYLDASGHIPSSDMLRLDIYAPQYVNVNVNKQRQQQQPRFIYDYNKSIKTQSTDDDTQTVVSHNSRLSGCTNSTISYAPKSYRPFRRRGINYDRPYIPANTMYKPHHMPNPAAVHPRPSRQRYFGANPRVYRPRVTGNYQVAQAMNYPQNITQHMAGNRAQNVAQNITQTVAQNLVRNVPSVHTSNIMNMNNATLYMNDMNTNEYDAYPPAMNYMSSNDISFSNESFFDTEPSRDISKSSIFDDNHMHPIFDHDEEENINFTSNLFDNDDNFNFL